MTPCGRCQNCRNGAPGICLSPDSAPAVEAVRLWRGDRRQAPILPDVRRRQESAVKAPMVGGGRARVLEENRGNRAG